MTNLIYIVSAKNIQRLALISPYLLENNIVRLLSRHNHFSITE